MSARNGAVVSPDQSAYGIVWSEEDQSREIAVRTLRVTDIASYHVIRLATAEKPHVHDHRDLTVFVLKGRAKMHLGNRITAVKAGDVIEIPRGIVHWAENVGNGPSVVYAVFSPPFDGVDRRVVE